MSLVGTLKKLQRSTGMLYQDADLVEASFLMNGKSATPAAELVSFAAIIQEGCSLFHDGLRLFSPYPRIYH
jgi:hypothetical protein